MLDQDELGLKAALTWAINIFERLTFSLKFLGLHEMALTNSNKSNQKPQIAYSNRHDLTTSNWFIFLIWLKSSLKAVWYSNLHGSWPVCKALKVDFNFSHKFQLQCHKNMYCCMLNWAPHDKQTHSQSRFPQIVDQSYNFMSKLFKSALICRSAFIFHQIRIEFDLTVAIRSHSLSDIKSL